MKLAGDECDFILEKYINSKVCEKLISEFESNPHKSEGTVGDELNTSIKKCKEISLFNIQNKFVIQEYFDELKKVLNEYKNIYEYSEKHQNGFTCSGLKIQKYEPGEGFFKWHYEQDGYTDDVRHLVFMTYLNTVEDGGENEFLYQKKKISPTIGKTIIWPSAWTHTHRGIVSNSGVKYIVTGWYSYTNTIKHNFIKY